MRFPRAAAGVFMLTSEAIDEIVSALCKAQAKIHGAVKGTKNTFFNSSYADLGALWDEAREPLTENGIAVIQSAEQFDAGIVVTTLLAHSSGQWIKSYTPPLMPKDRSPQAVGSCLTYGRRYGLAAAVSCPQVDDDGNAASGRGKTIHDPKGDLGADIPPDTAIVAADRIRELLASGNKAEASEYHSEITAQHDLYTAAWRLLASNERSAWKKMVEASR